MNPVYFPLPSFVPYETSGLYEAVVANDVAKVKECLQNSQRSFFQDPKTGNTPLHEAAKLKCGTILSLLLRHNNSQLDLKNRANKTPLYIAASAGNVEGCKILLEHGASQNILCGESHGRALHAAASHGHSEVVNLLVDTPIDAKTTQGHTAFYLACREGHPESAELLRNRGANPTVRVGDARFTALHAAALIGNTLVIRLFQTLPYFVNSRITDGATPFLLACQKGNLEAACELLVMGADPLLCQNNGQTALHEAAKNGHEEIIDLLKRNYALLEAKNAEKQTPLYQAAFKGHERAVYLLLGAGANPSILCSEYEDTALHIAAVEGHTRVIRAFRGSGVKVDTVDCDNATPFSLACEWGHLEAARELLAMEASINYRDNDGQTALHITAFKGHADIIALFSSRPDLLNARDFKGTSALEIASSNNHVAFVRTLLQYGVSIRVLSDVPLSYSREIISIFIEHQKQKIDACIKKIKHNIDAQEVLDVLIDQKFIIRYFSRTLKMDPYLLSVRYKASAHITTEAWHRLYHHLPVYQQRDIARLYNHDECRQLLEYVFAKFVDAPAKMPLSELDTHENAVKEFLAELQQPNLPDKITDGQRHLFSLFFEKHQKARAGQAFEKKEKAVEAPPVIYPLTDQQFSDASIYELLTKRYGLTDLEIDPQAYINTGLLNGADLYHIGVDNGFYSANSSHVKASLKKRMQALYLWAEKYPEHLEQIEYAVRNLKSLKKQLFAKNSVDDLVLSMTKLSLCSKQPLLCSVDTESARILLNLFVTKKEYIMNRELGKADATTLSEYVSKRETPFLPQYI